METLRFGEERAAMLPVQGRVRKADSSCSSSSLATLDQHGRLRANSGVQPTGTNMTRILFALLALFATALAQAQAWSPGVHYAVIPTQRSNVAPGKVEVMEVFSYGCPACNSFRPVMKKIKAALPPNAQLTYLPASWNTSENWPMFQRAYLTAL